MHLIGKYGTKLKKQDLVFSVSLLFLSTHLQIEFAQYGKEKRLLAPCLISHPHMSSLWKDLCAMQEGGTL